MTTCVPFALSMSGGGLSSYAYAGFIDVLYEHELLPSLYAGLSGGGVLAVLLASKYTTQEIYDFMEHLKTISLINTRLSHFEIIDHTHFTALLRSNLRYKTFEELPVPAVVFASDVVRREGIAIHTGDIASALAATCSVYPMLKPIKRNGHLLSDGGFTIYYGAKFLRRMGMEKVIGVDVTGITEGTVGGILRAYYQQLNASITSNTRYELREYPVDLDIKINFPSPSILTFNRKSPRILDLGRKKALQYLQQMRNLVVTHE